MINLRETDTIDFIKIEPITKEQYTKFIEMLGKAITFFNNIPKSETIRVISHLDADGITSAAGMLNALNNENKEYDLTIYSQLTDDVCQEIAKEEFTYYIITDLGSSQLKSINAHLKNKKILILDHHTPQEEAKFNIVHINPHLVGIDGSAHISGSGIVFFFAGLLNKKNYDFAHIALVGAIGDVQELNGGFTGLNNIILDIAIQQKKIMIKKELNLFGKQTRPLVKLLEYSSDLNIPGITGDQKAIVFFLKQLGINPVKANEDLKTFVDLTEEEKKQLAEHIIVKRIQAGLTDYEKVFSTTYELVDEDKGTFKDAKEFSTILNACGRMDQAKTGVYACLDEPGFKLEAKQIHKDYKIEIVHGMNWIEKQLKHNSNAIIQTDKYMIINAQNNIMHTIIGTVASILTMNHKFSKDYYVLSFAHNVPEKIIKVSMRVVGNNEDIDLQKMVSKMIEKLGCGEAGGHPHAAGAMIPIAKEQEFLDIAREELKKL